MPVGDEVVLVTGADELTASDLAVKGILASKGYGVFASTAANTSSAALDGRLMVVVSPSVATSGGTVLREHRQQWCLLSQHQGVW